MTTVGAFVLAIGILLVLINILHGLRRGAPAGPNPWDAPSLEWSVPSPPPHYNFAVQPVVASRHPLWEDRLQEGSGRSSLDRGPVLDNGKEMLLTSALDAEPDLIVRMPDDTLWPFLTTAAIAVLLAGLLLHLWWLAAAGGAAILLCALGWLWPRSSMEQTARPNHG